MPAPPCESQFPPVFPAHSLIQLHVRWWHTHSAFLLSFLSWLPSSLGIPPP